MLGNVRAHLSWWHRFIMVLIYDFLKFIFFQLLKAVGVHDSKEANGVPPLGFCLVDGIKDTGTRSFTILIRK